MSVEVGAFFLRLADGSNFTTYVSSGEQLTIHDARNGKALNLILKKIQASSVPALEIKYFHSHPDGAPDISPGDVLFAEYLRSYLRENDIHAAVHMYAVASYEGTLILTHMGLAP